MNYRLESCHTFLFPSIHMFVVTNSTSSMKHFRFCPHPRSRHPPSPYHPCWPSSPSPATLLVPYKQRSDFWTKSLPSAAQQVFNDCAVVKFFSILLIPNPLFSSIVRQWSHVAFWTVNPNPDALSNHNQFNRGVMLNPSGKEVR